MENLISSKLSDYNKNSNIFLNTGITALILFVATLISLLLFHFSSQISINAVSVYMLALVLISCLTPNYVYGIIASVASVMCVNFMFTTPYFKLNFILAGYPITFLVMLGISIFTSSIVSSLRIQSKILFQRERMLFEAEKEKTKANLLRAISHDLRTPLTSIIGASNLYLESENALTNDEKKDLIKNINEDANWLINIVENLLSITKIYNDSASLVKFMEPVEEVISESVVKIKKRLPNIKININVPDDLLIIPMDPILIEQVIINLVENAANHSNSELPIDLTVDSDDKNVYIHIKDYGTGISEERLSTIFDGTPPSKNNTSDAKKGMGIGLSICKTIILAHNGKIYARNHNNGAEFYFTLPKEEI